MMTFPDPDYDERRNEFPLTLAPRLVEDQFAIRRNEASEIRPSSVVKTEYSTFTYFVTSLQQGVTVTSTDIVVSSNVVTKPLYEENGIQPTPSLPIQPSVSNFVSAFSSVVVQAEDSNS